MSLRNILLGMLDQPAAGYDLKKRFEQSLAHFWDAELSQIYPTLKRLEDDGLLRSRTEPSDKGPDRKVYKRTAAGTRALEAWLAEAPDRKGERLTWLAQVWFMGQAQDPVQALAFLRALREDIAAELAQLQAIEAGWRRDDPRYPDALPDEEFYPQLTLDLGLTKLQAKVDWCERSIARIEARIKAGEGARSA